jgi:hypothetical protein
MKRMNNHSHTTDALPPWLQEQCTRLLQQDIELWNLNLNIRRLDEFQTAYLAEALRQNNVLRTLNLTSSFKHHGHALQLFASIVLPHHRSLKVLYLAYNDMIDVSGIGAALKSNVCLEELHLHNNCLTCESAEQIAESLQLNHTLKTLHLGYNRIHDRGCAALAQCLVHNSSLKVLGLDHNRITANGFAEIETALQHNIVIQQIDLSMSDSEVAETRISMLCRANQMGRSCLGNPQFGWNFWVLVLEAVQTDPDLLFYFLKFKPDLFLLSRQQ